MTESDILAALENLEPAAVQAFLDAVRALVDAATLGEIEALIAEGNINGVVDAVGSLPTAALAEVLRGSFIAGGRSVIVRIAPAGRPVEFDAGTPEAQAALNESADTLKTTVAREQAEAVRATISAGINRGQSPRETALDVIGRLSPQTGRRVGGVIGLAEPDARAVSNAVDQLMSGDPSLMRQYLTRKERDPRLDGIVHSALASGRAVSAVDAKRIATAYAERKLQARADLLSRKETLKAYNAGWHQLYVQQSQQAVAPASITKAWRSKGDLRVRHTHAALNGKRIPFDQLFQSPSGAQLLYPGDDAHGAGLNELAGCRCTLSYRVKWE